MTSLNPTMRVGAQMVEAAGTPEEARAQRVVAEAVRLEELTRDLLAFVRTGEIRRRDVAPAEVLRGAVDEVDASRIDVDAAAAPARWSLDDGRLRQALVNVLRNAIDAAPGERVAARLWSEGARLRVEVRDRGAGLDAGREDAIFEPFHTTKVHGTGLGLAVARRIVELHGGKIAARNHPAGGAIFDLSIPAVR
jgi:two-component system sensor histidine kinase HydH